MKDLIIIGAGGMGRDIAWLVSRINAAEPQWNLLGFVDDNPELRGKELVGCKVIGEISDIGLYPDAYIVCSIANARLRKSLIEKIEKDFPNRKYAALIDPTVEMSDYVTVGDGTVICLHTIISVNIKIGNHVIITSGCTVGHDTTVNDFVTFYPNATVSGFSVVGECAELGTGMKSIQEKRIGRNSIVGAGAVVIKDIPDNCTAAGNPAKPIKFHL